MTFTAMKFRVESPEHSEKIQKVLFDMGYSWYATDNKVKHTKEDVLVTYSDGNLCYCEKEYWSTLTSQTEYTLKEIISYELIPVPPPVELIELNGLKYKKSELEEALKLIKPIEEEK